MEHDGTHLEEPGASKKHKNKNLQGKSWNIFLKN